MPMWKRIVAVALVASPLAIATDATSLILNGTWIG